MSNRSPAAGASNGSQLRRRANLSIVLAAVIDGAPISQTSLIEKTGLKKPTISKLIDELHRASWVRPLGSSQGSLGRPRQLWAPDPDRGLVVSAQISVDQMSTLIVDFAGSVRAERSIAVDVGKWSERTAVDAVAQMISGALHDVQVADGVQRPVLGVAIAVPGIVSERGQLKYAPGLDWKSPDIAEHLRTALGDVVGADCPVFVENEANMATLAELAYGPHSDVRNMVFILGERGVGAGVVVDAELFRGAHRSGGEIGHVTVDVDGPECPCGKHGCWAMYVSQEVLRDQAIAARKAGRSSQLWGQGTTEAITSAEVVAAAQRGDGVSVELMARLRRYLAVGIGNLVSMYDPEVVVLGGFLRAAFADSVPALRAELDNWLMGGGRYDEVRIELAALGPDAPRWGGVRVVLRAVVAGLGASGTDG